MTWWLILFRASGVLAALFLIAAAFTGFFGRRLRKRIKGPLVLSIHKTCGGLALAFAALHFVLFSLFLE